MKAWFKIYALVLAAGMLTALADDIKTNAPAGATTSIPAATNEAAISSVITTTSPPPPAATHKLKPTVVVPLTQTSTAAASPKITSTVTLPSATATSTPAITGEPMAPEEGSLTPTGAVPAQPNDTTAQPPESPGIGRMGVLGIGVAVLVMIGGLAAFLLNRSRQADHASLITLAMSESKEDDRHEEKPEEKPDDKKKTTKFPPPMT